MQEGAHQLGFSIGQAIAFPVAGLVLGVVVFIASLAANQTKLGIGLLILCIILGTLYQWIGLIAALVLSIVLIVLVRQGKLKV